MANRIVLTVIAVLSVILATSGVCSLSRRQLKIAAFNIKSFGMAKLTNRTIANNIVNILQRYDMILIQEVRDNSETSLKLLQKRLNETEPWSYVASVPVGRTNYREQYVFFYRTKSLKVVGQYLYNDSSHDFFEREPFSVEIQFYSSKKAQRRYVTFLGLHTRPDHTPAELDHLSTAVKRVSQHFTNSDGVIAMGDFNADCAYLTRKFRANLEIFRPNTSFTSYIDETADTTVMHNTNCAYDRIVTIGDICVKNARVFDFKTEFGLPEAKALAVSDHYPVEFTLC